MNRRSLLTAMPAFALGLAGCSLPGATPAGPVTIRFGHYQEFVLQYGKLAEAFATTHPNVTVDVVPVTIPAGTAGADYAQSLEDNAECNRAFASVADAFYYVGTSPYVLDLTPLAQDLDEEDLYPGLLGQFRFNGGLWGIPQQVNLSGMIAYDRAIFAEAGVEVPQPGWTWDDLRVAAQALTVVDGDRTTRYGYVATNDSWDLYSVAVTAGGRLDAPEVGAATQRYADMILGDGSVYWRDWRGDATVWREYYNIVRYDRAAMWSIETYAYGQWREMGRDLGLIEVPQTPARAFAWGTGVNAVTEHPQECVQWADYLSRQQPLSGLLPVRPSVAKDWRMRFPAEDEEGTQRALQALAGASWTDMATSEGARCLSKALEAIIEEGMPVEAALAQAQAEWEQAQQTVATYPTPTAAPITLPTSAGQ